MKKKTIAALLVVPIVVSLLTYVSVQVLINQVATDISDIRIPYNANEGFHVSKEGYPLEAEAVYDESQLIREESKELVWSLVGESEDGVCEIREEDGSYYLYANKEGEATIRVANRTQSHQKSFTARCYEDGLVLINDLSTASGSSLAESRRYGQYEIDGQGRKSQASISLSVEVYVDGVRQDGAGSYRILEESDNIEFDQASGKVSLLDGGLARLTLCSTLDSSIQGSYSFEIVDEGVNVRDYDDLLWCTNRSEEGEIVVLQTSLGSLRDTYAADTDKDGNVVYREEYLSDTMRLFGHYDFQSQTFSFEDEVYTFPSTYPTDFIDQYNAYFKDDDSVSEVSKELVAGIHVQKDFYGNGFTLNMDNLAFPNHGTIGRNGILTPGEGDLFKGPLAFVALGTIGPDALIESFGQDNCGILIEADGVRLDDIRIQNTDNRSNMYDFFYTGSVVDVEGKNCTISNAIIANGKNVVRAFDSDGLLIDNCILQNGGQFLLYLGSNEANKADKNKRVSFSIDGTSIDSDFRSFMDSTANEDSLSADAFITEAMKTKDASAYLPFFQAMQEALDNTEGYLDSDGNLVSPIDVRVQDTSFSNSAVYSIAIDSMFNGGYLYNGMPSLVHSLLGDNAIPPQEVGGTSRPVRLSLEGDVRFYDWKRVESMDLSGLILQNVSSLLGSTVGMEITIDDFFPIKPILKDLLAQNGLFYHDEESGQDYVSTDIILYGGGANLSTVDFDSSRQDISEPLEIDFAGGILSGRYSPTTGNDTSDLLLSVLSKAVVAVTGIHPFRTYVNGPVDGIPEYFDKVPSLTDLRR